MKIAMLGHKRIPSREGGIEVVVEELASRMVSLGHSVVCFNRKGHHVSGSQYDTDEMKEYKGIVLKRVLTIDAKGMAAVSSSFFASICAALGSYDIVHFHAEGPCAMLWIAKLFGKKCVATIHGLDHKRAKWGKFASFYIMLGEKMAVKYADEIIVLSKSVQDYFKARYNRSTLLIPNGVQPVSNAEPELISKEYELYKDDYILYLGRIVPEKGIHTLIEAFQQVHTDKKLVIAGGNSDSMDYMNQLKEMAKNDSRILFTGFVQGRVLQELFSNAYVYVLPSELEGMPLSLLEAMSYGSCVLTSDIAECTDVTGDYGISFECGNALDLKNKLQYLLNNPDKVKRLAEMSASYICKKYSWDDVAEKTLNCYRELL